MLTFIDCLDDIIVYDDSGEHVGRMDQMSIYDLLAEAGVEYRRVIVHDNERGEMVNDNYRAPLAVMLAALGEDA